MIIISGRPADIVSLGAGYGESSVEMKILALLADNRASVTYKTEGALRFELALRRAIINAAEALRRSGLQFRVFRSAFCNPAYWTRSSDGGFALKRGASAAAAITDIFKNGSKYGTECATAMQIVYYGALLNVADTRAFDSAFQGVRLMNWHDIDPKLYEIGWMQKFDVYLPGDRLYFKNPDVNPETPEWQGENVIDMSDGTFYGHGIGRRDAKSIIAALNKNRRRGSNTGAFLMDSAGRPDFGKLYAWFPPQAREVTA